MMNHELRILKNPYSVFNIHRQLEGILRFSYCSDNSFFNPEIKYFSSNSDNRVLSIINKTHNFP